jgi:hypothetical protein
MNDVAKVLNAAADLIEPEGRWTKGAFARDAYGEVVVPVCSEACSWCAVGAIRRVTPDEGLDALPAFRRHLGDGSDISHWNDQQPGPGPVVAALRAAARSVEQEALR